METNEKRKKVNEGPIVETQMTMSEDGRWFIHRTVITDIKSRKYIDKVLAEDEEPENGSSQSKNGSAQRGSTSSGGGRE